MHPVTVNIIFVPLKIIVNPKYGQLRHFVEHISDVFDSGGRVIFEGRNVIKTFVADCGGKQMEVVVKRYKRPNIVQKMAYSLFRSTKAMRAYNNAVELKRRGFSTPEQYAFVETRVGGLIDYCYFFSAADYSPAISDMLCSPTSFNRTMAADYARFVARLHENGVLDIDLNSGNVLYRIAADGHYSFSLIDINRMRFYSIGRCVPMAECMENLTRFTGCMELFEYVARQYAGARGFDEAMVARMMEVKARHDQRWEKKKRFAHLFKKKK